MALMRGEKFNFGPMIRLGGVVGSVSAHRVRDSGSNPGLGESFPLKLKILGRLYFI